MVKLPITARVANWIVSKSSVFNLDPTFLHGGVRSATRLSKNVDEKPYQFHSWVYSAAHIISVNLSRLPHVIVETANDGTETVHKKHPIIDLLNKPNPVMTKTAFWEAIVLGLMLPTTKTPGGQVFIIPEDRMGGNVKVGKGVMPARLWPLTDEVIEADVKKGQIIGWKFREPLPGKSTVRKFEPDEIIRIFLYNPYDIKLGLSPFSAAAIAVNQDVKADELNSTYFENSGVLAGALTTEQTLTRPQRAEMLKSFLENYFGPSNHAKIGVFDAGLKYEQFARSNLDMQYAEQKILNKDQIFAVYGVNELAFGRLSKIPFANVKEGRKILWQDTYIPIQDVIWESTNAQWIEDIPPNNLKGRSDLSNVPALKEDFMQKIKGASQLTKDLNVPPAVAINLFEIPIDTDKHPHLNSVFVNPLLVDITQGQSGHNDNNTGHNEPKKIAKSDNGEEERERLRQISDVYIEKVLMPNERKLNKDMVKFFNRQRNAFQDTIDELMKKLGKGETPVNELSAIGTTKALVLNIDDLLTDQFDEDILLVNIYSRHVKGQMDLETLRLEAELGGLVSWQVTPENIQKFIDMRKEQIKAINTTTFKQARKKIGSVVEDAVLNNLTVAELGRNLKEAVFDVSQIRINNSQTIARTEIGTISSQTREAAFLEEGIKNQQWITARDDLVRDSHRAEDGEIVEVGSPFPNTGLRFPRDPGGPVEEIVNCRCVAIAVRT